MKEELNIINLLYPLDTNDFFDNYWEKKTLHLSRKDASYYLDLFSRQDLDSVLSLSKPQPPAIRVVKNQQELLPSEYLRDDGSFNLNKLYKTYQEGYTIIINGLQNFWKPLGSFCLRLQNYLNHFVVANLYFSPIQSQGLSPHFDTHDVFVLQVEGSKCWKIYESFQSVPLLGSFQPILSQKQLPPLFKEVYLEAGDLLYIPRGYVHEAITTKSSSLHLTIGIYPSQWLDLMINALTALSVKEASLRQALPVGYLDKQEMRVILQDKLLELTELFANKGNIDEAINLLDQRLISQTIPIPDGHFSQLDKLNKINLETVLQKRLGMRCYIAEEGLSVSIKFPGNTIKGPIYIEPALSYIAEISGTDSFTPSLLPDSLTSDDKIILVRRLIRGGLLRIIA